jgi:hypothetical protein
VNRASRIVLILLLAGDAAFIALHILLWSRGQLTPWLNVEADGSLPECFQYLKWLTSALACLVCFIRRREGLYLGWAALFTYFLFDDADSLHERFGSDLTIAFNWTGALGLRGQDFGELLTTLIAGAVLLGAIAWLYWLSESRPARAFTRRLLPWLALLVFFGVGIDMLHVVIGPIVSPVVFMLAGVAEDGGEMIAASFLTAFAVDEALGSIRRT